MKLVVTVAIALASAQSASGDTGAAIAPPCKGCIVDAPATAEGAIPLLVVLHGDRERPSATAARWRAATRERGWVLLALQCPSASGCKQSWWRWNGDPAWVRQQVAKLAESIAADGRRSIDASRMYIAGWSGGASYLGRHASAWADPFAGIVFHGGGLEPLARGCPTKPLPAYFLVGDKNPLHMLRPPLHEHFKRCKQDTIWNLLRNANHDGERRALTPKRALEILDWLAKSERRP